MRIAVVKYNAGNTKSVSFALKRLGVEPIITSDHDEISGSDKVIFPGVGEASSTMSHLRSENLDKLLPELQQPVLGICLGMQVMCSYSEEGNTDCLGIFKQIVRRLPESEKVPHIGWNQLDNLKSALFYRAAEGDYAYYLHSYFVPINNLTVATTHYSAPVSAAIQKDNFFGVQFHPEKSGEVGSGVLQCFLEL